MSTKTVELYIDEEIKSGIIVEGMIGEDYVEVLYKYILNHPNELAGVYHVTKMMRTVARGYATIKGRKLENNSGDWKPTGRRKITDEMYSLLAEVENHLHENGYIIIE